MLTITPLCASCRRRLATTNRRVTPVTHTPHPCHGCGLPHRQAATTLLWHWGNTPNLAAGGIDLDDPDHDDTPTGSATLRPIHSATRHVITPDNPYGTVAIRCGEIVTVTDDGYTTSAMADATAWHIIANDIDALNQEEDRPHKPSHTHSATGPLTTTVDQPHGPHEPRHGATEPDGAQAPPLDSARTMAPAQTAPTEERETMPTISRTTNIADTACITDDAWITGDTTVDHWAVVAGNAEIHGHARIQCHARVNGHATIGGHALITGGAEITGHAHVGDNAVVGDNAYVTDYADIGGHALITGRADIRGHAILAGHMIVDRPDGYLTLGPVNGVWLTAAWDYQTYQLAATNGYWYGSLDELVADTPKIVGTLADHGLTSSADIASQHSLFAQLARTIPPPNFWPPRS